MWTVFSSDPTPSPLHSFAQFLAVPARKRVSDLNVGGDQQVPKL